MASAVDGDAAAPPLISVIVVNWNGGEQLERCLEALARQTHPRFEVILVDNGSTDGSLGRAAEGHPGVRVLDLGENTGFAAANNRGAAIARGQWLALLNNDAFPEPDWLERLAEAAERQPGYVGFASLQIQHRAPGRLDGAGDAYHVSGLPWRTAFDQAMGPPWNQARDVFSPCACAAMYRRDAFLAVGGFDEAFFCYVEDVDLGFRLRLAGERFRFVPEAIVRHVGSASTGKTSDFVRYHGHRNLVWCFLKNMPTPLLIKHLPAHLLMTAICLVFFTLSGQGRAIWRAKWDALGQVPRVWRQRRAIQRERRASARSLERQMAAGLVALWARAAMRP